MRKIPFALFLLACTVFVFFQMRPTNRRLKTEDTRMGILDLEFAYDIHSTSKILYAWQPGNRIDAAKKNTYIDFALLFFYALFLFYCCRQLAKNFSGNIRNLGIWLSVGALIAGGLDVIENSGMLLTLNGYQSIFISLITAVCALIKWLIALTAVLYIIITSPFALYLSAKNKNTETLKIDSAFE